MLRLLPVVLLLFISGCGPTSSDAYRSSQAAEGLKIPDGLDTPKTNPLLEVPVLEGSVDVDVEKQESPPDLLNQIAKESGEQESSE